MNCPHCSAWTSVERTVNKGMSVLRRRVCANAHKFTTKEIAVPTQTHGGDRKSKIARGKTK
jgi:transcriptional regulator NrdR family protein